MAWPLAWPRRAAALLLLVLCAVPSGAAAQAQWDPAATVSAYSAALNAHDVDSALALFDDYGSASDKAGRHFTGRAGLTEFLLSSGFGNPSASITTSSLVVVGNRALWTYTCSCAGGGTDVRVVLVHDKISVFAIIPPPASPLRKADAGVPLSLVGLALVAGGLAGALGLWRGRSAVRVPRATQGQLLAALVEALVEARAARLTQSAVPTGSASSCPRQP